MTSLSFIEGRLTKASGGFGQRRSVFEGMFVDNLTSFNTQKQSVRSPQNRYSDKGPTCSVLPSSTTGASPDAIGGGPATNNNIDPTAGATTAAGGLLTLANKRDCAPLSCRVFRSESTMPAVAPSTARRLPDDTTTSPAFSQRLTSLIQSGNVSDLETFIAETYCSATHTPVLVNTRLDPAASNACGYTNCTPLGLAIILDNHELVGALIKLGADVTVPPCLYKMSDGKMNNVATPLHLATMRFCNISIFNALLSNNEGEESVRLIPPTSFFPVLQYVAKCPDIKVAEKILNALDGTGKGVKEYINVRDDYGKTALHVATKEGSADVVRLLVEKGIDVNAKDKTRKTALMYASRRGRSDAAIELLLYRGADVAQVDSSGRTALHYAVQNEHLSATLALLKAGADPLLADLGHVTSVEHAILTSSPKNSSPQQSKCGIMPNKILHALVAHTKSPICLKPETFYRASSDLIAQYSDQADLGTMSTLKRLCGDNATLVTESFPSSCETLLHTATRHTYSTSIVQWLVTNYKFDLNRVGDDRYSPLGLAVRVGAADSAKILIRAGADINYGGEKEAARSPLWIALTRGHGHLVEVVVEGGCDVTVEMPLKSLRVAEARTGQPSRGADDPLMQGAQRTVNPFEFALHKGDVKSAYIIAKAYGATPAYKFCSDEDRQIVLDLLDRASTLSSDDEFQKDSEKIIAKLTDWIATGKSVKS